MKTKKIFVIVFSIAVIVLLGLITAYVVIFAAMKQTVTSNIKVMYTAVDIQGSVQATYQVGDKVTYLTKEGTTETKVSFNAVDENQYASLVFPAEEVELTAQNNEILITYMFTNLGERIFTALMNFDAATFVYNNMKLEYSLDNESFSEDQYALVVKSSADPSETVNYYIKITVLDIAKNANLSGTINWLLERYDTDSDEQEIAIQTSHYTKNDDGTYSAFYNGQSLVNGQLVIPSMVGSAAVANVKASPTNVDKTQVKSVKIAQSVQTLEQNAFAGFTNLETITFEQNSLNPITNLQNGLKSIGQQAFYNCSSLLNIEIPSTVTTIGDKAFEGCESLQNVTIADSVNFVGAEAFNLCSNLSNIYINTSGWFTTDDRSATSGASITFTDSGDAATKFKANSLYYFKRG